MKMRYPLLAISLLDDTSWNSPGEENGIATSELGMVDKGKEISAQERLGVSGNGNVRTLGNCAKKSRECVKDGDKMQELHRG